MFIALRLVRVHAGGGLVVWLRVRACKLDSSRASLSRKILRKHARTEAFDSLGLSTRAVLHIFIETNPTRHIVLCLFLAARASVRRNWGQSKISLALGVAPDAELS